MTARLIFIASLVFAFLALRGWPEEAGAWIRALSALASLMIGLGAAALLSPSPKVHRFKSTRRPGAWNRLVSGACIVVAGGLFYFILVFAPPAARQFSAFLYAVVAGSATSSDDDLLTTNLDGPNQGQGDGSGNSNNEFEIRTFFDPDGAVVPKSATLSPSDEPQVSLITSGPAATNRLQNAGPIYMHAFSHHAFNGERWMSPGFGQPKKLTQGLDGLIHLHIPESAAVFQYRVLHHLNFDWSNTVNTLQGARFVKLPEITQLNPGTWLLAKPSKPSKYMGAYEAGSSPRRFRDLVARRIPIEASHQDPAFLAPTTDPSLELQIQNLATQFQNNPSLEQQLMDLQGWLTQSITYSLDVNYSDPNQSVLEGFLGNPEAREGFCVHFASAAVLLLRELGMPARITYGWMGGELFQEHNQFLFRGEHAHAWAEIFVKGQGWVVFETTPASGLPQSDDAPRDATPPAAGESTEQKAEESIAANATESEPWMRWAWVALIAAAAGLLVVLLIKRGKLANREVDLETDAIRKTPGYLQLFHEACIGLGHPKPTGRTLLQHLKRLDQEGLSIPFADELLNYHYQVAYHEAPRDARCERRLRSQIKAFRQETRPNRH